MKIALGMIVRELTCAEKLKSFIKNASTYGHTLDCLIVAHTREHDPKIEQELREKATLYTVNVKNPKFCKEQMQKLGVPEKAQQTLLNCPIDTKKGLVPYGHNRMIVVMEAILRGADILIFVDSDVTAKVLKKTPEGAILEEVDFFGEHLKHLKNGIDVTTGEYSGYNILPPASFDGMSDYLYGVKKGNMLEFWQNSNEHRSIVYQPSEVIASPSNKILGGNLAIRLSAFAKLPPFFSSHYTVDDEMYLCRGEDTVLGFEIAALGTTCMDIGIYPLHDTYDNYPVEPNLKNDVRVQERLFYASTGWVGRNPFFNYILGKDPQDTREFQRKHLEKGLNSLVKYTSNPMYHRVLECFDTSWNSLNRYISEFENVTEAWEQFKKGTQLV